jgi:hypothetical protein
LRWRGRFDGWMAGWLTGIAWHKVGYLKGRAMDAIDWRPGIQASGRMMILGGRAYTCGVQFCHLSLSRLRNRVHLRRRALAVVDKVHFNTTPRLTFLHVLFLQPPAVSHLADPNRNNIHVVQSSPCPSTAFACHSFP